MDWGIWGPNLWRSTIETLYMVGVSTLFTVILGLPIGVLLVTTDRKGLTPVPSFNQVLGTIVNITRSLPFIILLVLVIPLTRKLVGTSIGSTAAIVPLVLAAIPFYARVAETGLREVDRGVIEAAQAMGCSNWEIIRKVLIPESLPSLILGIALTVISLISYSAMAGVVGGGGLGDVAIRFGYQRYQTEVMIATVILLIIIVQLIQVVGNWLAARVSHR